MVPPCGGGGGVAGPRAGPLGSTAVGLLGPHAEGCLLVLVFLLVGLATAAAAVTAATAAAAVVSIGVHPQNIPSECSFFGFPGAPP